MFQSLKLFTLQRSVDLSKLLQKPQFLSSFILWFTENLLGFQILIFHYHSFQTLPQMLVTYLVGDVCHANLICTFYNILPCNQIYQNIHEISTGNLRNDVRNLHRDGGRSITTGGQIFIHSCPQTERKTVFFKSKSRIQK